MLRKLTTILWTRVFALYALGLGLLMSGPVLITITPPGTYEDFFAYIATAGSLAGLGMLIWVTASLIIFVTNPD